MITGFSTFPGIPLISYFKYQFNATLHRWGQQQMKFTNYKIIFWLQCIAKNYTKFVKNYIQHVKHYEICIINLKNISETLCTESWRPLVMSMYRRISLMVFSTLILSSINRMHFEHSIVVLRLTNQTFIKWFHSFDGCLIFQREIHSNIDWILFSLFQGLRKCK